VSKEIVVRAALGVLAVLLAPLVFLAMLECLALSGLLDRLARLARPEPTERLVQPVTKGRSGRPVRQEWPDQSAIPDHLAREGVRVWMDRSDLPVRRVR
jgi:hypothetical protein